MYSLAVTSPVLKVTTYQVHMAKYTTGPKPLHMVEPKVLTKAAGRFQGLFGRVKTVVLPLHIRFRNSKPGFTRGPVRGSNADSNHVKSKPVSLASTHGACSSAPRGSYKLRSLESPVSVFLWCASAVTCEW